MNEVDIAASIRKLNHRLYDKTKILGFLKDHLEIQESFNNDYTEAIICDKYQLDKELRKYAGVRSQVFTTPELRKLQTSSTFDDLYEGTEPLTEDGKVVKKVLRKGNGEKPPLGAPIWVHFIIHLEGDIQPFSTTFNLRLPHPGILGQSSTLEYKKLLMPTMEFGEIAMVVSHPDYAFKLGFPPTIPSDVKVAQIIELVDAPASRKVPILYMTPEEVAALPVEDLEAEVIRLLQLAKREADMDLNLVMQCLCRAVMLIQLYRDKPEDEQVQEDDTASDRVDHLLVQTYENLAKYYLLVSEPEKVCALAELMDDEGLEVSGTLYYHLSEALIELGQLDAGCTILELACRKYKDTAAFWRILALLKAAAMADDDDVLEECLDYFTATVDDLMELYESKREAESGFRLNNLTTSIRKAAASCLNALTGAQTA